MKILEFNFKREAVWIVILSIAIPLVGVIVLLAFSLFRSEH
jgi:hypothetical protein